jgi:hypothetical protein
LKKPGYRKRALLVILCATTQQCSGILVITNFGASLYAGLGYGPTAQQLIGAGWITVAPVVSIPMMLVVDKVRDKPLVLHSMLILVVVGP